MGFNEKYYVTIDEEGFLTTGYHRVSISTVLENKVPTKKVKGRTDTLDLKYLKSLGFTTEDQMRILKGFIDIKSESSSICILWQPILKYSSQIKKIIEKEFNIVGKITLNFESNFIAFRNIFLDIYSQSKGAVEAIEEEKFKTLESSKLELKVIVINRKNEEGFFKLVKNLKETVRKFLDFECLESFINIADSKNECQYLSQVTLSPNNINHLKMRLNYQYHPNFLRKCNKIKNTCKKEGINIKDICIVGLAPLCVLGITKDADINFVSKKTIHTSPPPSINDNTLIDNCEYHFMFLGLKFANLQIIKEDLSTKEESSRYSIRRSIELFEKMQGYRNQKRLLMERIREERNLEKQTRIKRVLKNIICLFIPTKKLRKKFRRKVFF